MGGLLYLAIIALGLFVEVLVRGRILVAQDAMATVANLRAHESLWRWGIAAEVLSLICVTVLMLVWLILLAPVSRRLTWLALFFALTANIVQICSLADSLSALFPIGKAAYLSAFTAEQLAALVKFATRTQGQGYGISLLFTGCFFLLAGPLIYRSGYLPRPIGVLYGLAGVGYVLNTFVLILAPALAGRIFMFAVLPIFIGETTLALWLLTKGVDPEGWNRRQRSLMDHGRP
jgi:hypothetical protein